MCNQDPSERDDNAVKNDRRRLNRKLAASLLISSLLITGCSRLKEEIPVLLYLAMAIDQDTTLTTSTQADFRRRIQLIADDYRRINPRVHVQVELYERDNLLEKLQRRNASDLGPDLIITDTLQANQLFAAGLTEAVPIPEAKRQDTDPPLWERVSTEDGHIVAQPIVIFPQIACFNKTVIDAPPTTLSGLQQQGASGARIGLPVKFSELLWTAGSMGSLNSLARAGDGQTLSAQNVASIQGWLRWLEEATSENNITFFQDQGQLENLLKDGELDWVSCNANSLLRLRETMDENLGVSPLPSGPGGKPSPVNDVRVLALGSNSSPRQREFAITLTHYITNAMVQRNLSVRSLAFLPVNPNVDVPVQGSGTLQTLMTSKNEARQYETDLAGLVHHRDLSSRITPKLIPLIFGAADPRSRSEALIDFLQKRS